MERRLHTDEFEDLIKQKSDQYKMYPSDRVWKEINRSLHPRRKWYWFGFALLLSGVGYYSISELTSPVNLPRLAETQTNAPGADESQAPSPAELVPFKTPARPVRKDEGSESFAIVSEASRDHNNSPQASDQEAPVVRMDSYFKNSDREVPIVPSLSEQLDLETIPGSDFIERLLSNIDPPTVRVEPQPTKELPSAYEQEKEIRPSLNWLHEYAAYELSVPKTKRLSWQLFFSPTMNYRKLTGSRNAYLGSEIKNIPLALNIRGELDRLVNHKPALGFEIGSAVFYALNKSISLKLGMQFNYSRYSIQAFNTPTEIGTIALTSNPSRTGPVRDSIRTYTQVSNFGGISQREMDNQYFQLSAPIGIEWRLLGSGRLQLNVAGSFQPTYLLNKNTYLITTDYKNYIKEPSLVRRWNVNTSAEAYLSYKTGGVRWQLGPQFRYQLLSSYSNEYPIKEYLMEYGVKIGVTKTIR